MDLLLYTWPVKMVTNQWAPKLTLYTICAYLALVGYSQECPLPDFSVRIYMHHSTTT